MALLTRAQILKAKNTRSEKVNVPSWGGDVYVKSLSVKKKVELTKLAIIKLDEAGGDKADDTAYAEILTVVAVIKTVCGRDNKPLFKDEDYDDLLDGDAAAIEQCFEVSNRLNQFIKTGDVDPKKK